MSVLTVFVSARTDELHLERIAAYEAIGQTGRIPLALDTALNKLSDGALLSRTQEEEKRFSGRRTLREQVDALLDASDAFVGVYCRTAGVPDYSIGWLTWIEYELLRFLTRMVFIRSHGLHAERGGGRKPRFHRWRPLTRLQLRRLNALMRDPAHIAELRRDLHDRPRRGRHTRVERVHTVLAERCRFFLKRTQEEAPALSYDLQEFLLPLRNRVTEVRTSVLASSRPGDYRFFPAHADLFESLYSALGQWQDGPGRRAPQRSVRVHVRREVHVENRPAILYPLLRILFQLGMNIRQLFVNCPAPGKRRLEPGILCVARHMRNVDKRQHERLVTSLRRLLREELGEVQEGLRVEVKSTAQLVPGRVSGVHRLRRRGVQAYAVRALNVPGMLWSLTTLIASYGGNIVHLRFDEATGAPPEGSFGAPGCTIDFDVAFELDPKAAREAGPRTRYAVESFHANILTFEHQLKILHGVVSVRRLSSDAP